MQDGQCLIWGTVAKIGPPTGDGKEVDSPRAGGRYFISGTAEAIVKNWDEVKKVHLTSWLVEQRRLGVAVPKVDDTLEEIRYARPIPVDERADNLLRYLSYKSELLGDVLSFYALENDASPNTPLELLAWTGSRKLSEVITLAEFCKEMGWVDHKATERVGASKNTKHELMLVPRGYARLVELDGINRDSKRAFVAMWFDDSMSDAYKAIDGAIRDVGYSPIRIDRKDHNNKIDDEIVAEIRRSRFVVADFTQGQSGARGGVYYEAGLAHGLNIPVIFACKDTSLGDVHFDTRQYNHIVWKTPEELRDKLATRIAATIGDGPDKKDG